MKWVGGRIGGCMLIEEKWQKYVGGTGRWRKKRFDSGGEKKGSAVRMGKGRFGGEDGQRKVRQPVRCR